MHMQGVREIPTDEREREVFDDFARVVESVTLQQDGSIQIMYTHGYIIEELSQLVLLFLYIYTTYIHVCVYLES